VWLPLDTQPPSFLQGSSELKKSNHTTLKILTIVISKELKGGNRKIKVEIKDWSLSICPPEKLQCNAVYVIGIFSHFDKQYFSSLVNFGLKEKQKAKSLYTCTVF
jgi:hypothetical protein